MNRRRRALVYCSGEALRQAQRLLPRGAVLESLAQDAISRGDVYGGEYAGFVFLDQFGLACRFVRRPGRTRPRPRGWLITRLEPKRQERDPGLGLEEAGGPSFPSAAPRRPAQGEPRPALSQTMNRRMEWHSP
jgi:hypothetical protein